MESRSINDRQEYYLTQIKRSQKKFSYCKVSIQDTLRYVRLARDYFTGVNLGLGPVVCMGTRNGREVDLFRIALESHYLWKRIIACSERQSPYPHCLFPFLENYPLRSDCARIKVDSVVGIEINPKGARRDIFNSSFDSLPEEWSGLFGILFSNSFDHSIDPERTVREWIRVVRPGGMLIILWAEAEATETDLVGGISEEYLTALFKLRKLDIPGSKSICGYNELFLLKE